MKRFFKLFLIIFLGILLGSCDILNQFLPSSSSSSSSNIDNYTISFKDESIKLDVDESTNLIVSFNNETENKELQFESSDTKIVSVDQTGLIKGISSGVARITATAENNAKASCLVTVYNVIEKVSINKINSKIYAGDVVELSATIIPENVKDNTLTWSIDQSDCATLDNNILTAIKPGIINISVKTPRWRKKGM